MEKLERIKQLGRGKINYKKPKKNKQKANKEPKNDTQKVTEDQEKAIMALTMELSSLTFFFDYFNANTKQQVQKMTDKIDYVDTECRRTGLFLIFKNLELSLRHLKRDLPKMLTNSTKTERELRKDQLDDCIEQLFKIVQ